MSALSSGPLGHTRHLRKKIVQVLHLVEHYIYMGVAPLVMRRSPEEITTAINGLSISDREALNRFAIWTARGCPGHWDYKDLVQESIRATIEGRRTWSVSVDFPTHLRGCVRSLAHSWRKSQSLIDNIPSGPHVSSFEQRVIAAETIEKILSLFCGDLVGLVIIEALMDGESPHETIARLGISSNVYAAARRRIRRRIANSVYAQGGSYER
jgi:DNA-directed RNA polymerase specialized sigma24 family protein